MQRCTICLACLGALLVSFLPAGAQYVLPQDTLSPAEEDSVPIPALVGESAEDSVVAVEPPRMSEKDLVELAARWVKRLLYRGVLDTKVIGAYAQYQLTAWSEPVGSFGPVEARASVAYLGPTRSQERHAEWLQAAFQTVSADPSLVEFDLTVASSPTIREILQAYVRVNRGVVQPFSFALPAGQVEPDTTDRPVDEGTEEVKLFSGTYSCEKMRGYGDNGMEVVTYRSPQIAPLRIVRLGYGDQGLTYTGGGDDASARFFVPGAR